jgi:hypothetical protein
MLRRVVMEVVSTSETSVLFYETTRLSIPEDCHLNTRLRENHTADNSNSVCQFRYYWQQYNEVDRPLTV